MIDLASIIILGLAGHRAWRFAAVDDMPLLVRIRAWALGSHEIVVFDIPGKPKQTVTHYRRPTLRHLIECPWCLGTYISVGLFVLWREWPDVAVWPIGLLAVGEVVGLIGRNLDPVED